PRAPASRSRARTATREWRRSGSPPGTRCSATRPCCRRRPELLDLGGLELAPLAGLEPAERERPVARAVQPQHGVADRGEHPLHLVLAALVHRQLDAARREPVRAGRCGTAVVELDALFEARKRVG